MLNSLLKRFAVAALAVVVATALKFTAPSLFSQAARFVTRMQAVDAEVMYQKTGELLGQTRALISDFSEIITDVLLDKTTVAVSSVTENEDRAVPAFQLPLKLFTISSSFGFRDDPIDGERRYHKGIDLAAAEGSEVFPVRAGVVILCRSFGDYGNCVVVVHSGGLYSLYAHLSKINVFKGMFVCPQTVIGFVGASGRATGPHLHVELVINDYYCDPAELLFPDVV